MSEKLNKNPFDQQYRFRESRECKDWARCQLCLNNVEGYCVHPERARRVILSDPPGMFKNQPRWDRSGERVCDCVEIELPWDIKMFPTLPEKHCIVQKGHLIHADPLCPHILAQIKDDGLSAYNRFIQHDITGWECAGSYNVCELCGDRLGLKIYRADSYRRKVGIPDNMVALPPRAPFPVDAAPDAPFGNFDLVLKLCPCGWSTKVEWTKEAACDAVRRIKQLLNNPPMLYVPDTPTSKGYHGADWHHIRPLLNLVGWSEIADRIQYEIAVLQWGSVYCLNCFIAGKPYCFRDPMPPRHMDRPICPNCNSDLEGHTAIDSYLRD